jgi:hypothetical protein
LVFSSNIIKTPKSLRDGAEKNEREGKEKKKKKKKKGSKSLFKYRGSQHFERRNMLQHQKSFSK